MAKRPGEGVVVVAFLFGFFTLRGSSKTFFLQKTSFLYSRPTAASHQKLILLRPGFSKMSLCFLLSFSLGPMLIIVLFFGLFFIGNEHQSQRQLVTSFDSGEESAKKTMQKPCFRKQILRKILYYTKSSCLQAFFRYNYTLIDAHCIS